MEYDISVHIGQQIENFLNGYAAGDVGIMERTKSNMKELLDKSGLKQIVETLDKWDIEKPKELEKIIKKAKDALKVIAENNDSDLFIDLEEIKQDTINAINELEGKYWNRVRELILESVNEEKL